MRAAGVDEERTEGVAAGPPGDDEALATKKLFFGAVGNSFTTPA
ncbi:hypothetical protein [Streptomyces atratus]